MVEDDAADAFVLERSLTASCYQLVRARSIAQAKRILEHQRPAAIVLDVVLRGDESRRFIVQLRQQDEIGAILLIVSSSTGGHRCVPTVALTSAARGIKDALARASEMAT
jgi:DNA-binding response OmpR family regulator